MKSKYMLKTRPTDEDPLQVIAEIPDGKKQADARTLLDIFAKAIGKPPVVWGEKAKGQSRKARQVGELASRL